uniref:Uncharacterized protein n=1 Tax=Romanomermis culicivorax TaxID=13658 RepID=A0A915KG00_ROMCU
MAASTGGSTVPPSVMELMVDRSNSGRKIGLVSCEACEMVSSPQKENAMEKMPECDVRERVLAGKNVITDRFCPDVSPPPTMVAVQASGVNETVVKKSTE